LKNPNHLPHQQPRFRARIIDVNSGSEINCVSFDFIASGSLPGFKTSSINKDVIYKDWTPITINLGEYAGKAIKLEFITSDCTPGRDFGYAYIDIMSNCGNPLAYASQCDTDNFLTLVAPEGFQGYSWYMNNDYSTPISTQMNYKVTPVPAAATSYSLVIHPYPGFGCVDTFSAPVKWQPKPAFEAGPDRQILCNELIQLGATSNPGNSYSWTPVDKLTDPLVSNPRLKNLIFSPVNFVVTTTDNVTRCVSKDSVLITPKNCFVFVPTAFTPNGDGLNDVLRPYLGGIEKFKRFSIYNRAGNLVFSTTNKGEGWDGYYKGVKLDPAVFVWMLEYTSKDEQVVLEKGTVSLIK
jgi:gliding motility-associated-like protein